jgi:hypothetical protein
MPRFVVLRHVLPAGAARSSHFDVMLERDGVLRTWACASLPEMGESQEAEQLADHRPAYLEYEGDVSGNRGSVLRVAAGSYELVAESAEELQVRLASEQLSGLLVLKRIKGHPQRWNVSLAPG